MSESRKNVGRNVIYQTVYQILAVITPLITSPYVSRVLGAEGLGEYSFAWTNSLYFTLFAMLGVTNYGVRSIANVQNHKEKRSAVFWNIYAIQAFMTSLMLILYVLYVCFFIKGNKIPAITQMLIIVGCAFDVNWYFFGVEKFKLTVMRNIIVKILTVLSVLLFVNKETGVLGYCVVMALGTFISNAVLFPFLKKEIIFIKPTWMQIKSHIIPNLGLFIPVLASSVFHIMDKTMLGTLSGKTQLGYYINADKVINIPIGIITGLGTVYLPRITAMRNETDETQVKNELYKSLEIHSFAIFSLSFGLAAIANEFSPLFFGLGFEPCAGLIIAFAPAFIFKSYSSYFRTNVLIPYKKEKQYTIAVIVGAVVNFVANAILIPQYKAMGAVYGTVLAEIAVFLLQLYRLPVKYTPSRIISTIVPYCLIGVFMCIAIRLVSNIPFRGVILVGMEILLGGFVYSICCVIFWKITGRENIIKVLLKK